MSSVSSFILSGKKAHEEDAESSPGQQAQKKYKKIHLIQTSILFYHNEQGRIDGVSQYPECNGRPRECVNCCRLCAADGRSLYKLDGSRASTSDKFTIITQFLSIS